MRHALLPAAFCLTLLTPSPSVAQPAPLSAYWPNEDGRTWLYDQHIEEFFPSGVVVDDMARLWFEGTAVAPVGIPVQVLKGSVASLPAARVASTAAAPAEVTNPLLRRLWTARPDLRPGILRAEAGQPCTSEAVDGWGPLLLTGGLAYRQTSSEVGAWRCDVPNTQAWLWLTSDLTPGSTATLQLIPDVVDNVFLHLTVLGLEVVTVPAGTFQDCLHVDYVIDYGYSECTDPSGNFLGTARYETTGFVRYAPGTGPVECFEEFVLAEVTGDCSPPLEGVIARSSLKLNAPSVPAVASSWGRLKADYR